MTDRDKYESNNSTKFAEESGVSRGTVDRVLNNRGKVRPEVEERVRKVAEELGYKPKSF